MKQQQFMKTLLKVLFIVLPALLVACDGENDSNLSRGEIIGYDATLCACCGGYIIKIDGFNYLFFDEDVHGGSPFNIMDINYPVNVLLDWSLKTGDCPNGRIEVFKIIPTTP
jgi:hypothetical protein